MHLTPTPVESEQPYSGQTDASAVAAVLLVEPDQATRQLYMRALRQHWAVAAVRTVAEAVMVLPLAPALRAIVIEPYAGESQIDWQMLSQLRSSTRNSLPIIFCSTLDERGRGEAWGATLYLLKPVSPQQLVTELSTVLM